MQKGQLIDIASLKRTHRPVDSNYILRILRHDMAAYWSWGTRALRDLNGMGLRMTVSGFKHKGYVHVLLNGGDLFDVVLTTNRGVIKEVIPDIYLEDLIVTIDNAVEFTGSDYADRVKKAKYRI